MKKSETGEELRMVVKTICVIAMIMLSAIVASAQYSSIDSYVMFFNYKNDVEAGIELFLYQNPENKEYDAWEKIIRNFWNPIYNMDENLRKYNYFVDSFNHKKYLIYEPQKKIYYYVMVLKGIGASLVWTYPMGWEVCIMSIVFSSGRGVGYKKLTEEETKIAVKNFEKRILPQIKEYIKKAKK